MTTTDAEKEMLSSLQKLRTLDYLRYSEMLRAITVWVQSESERLMPSERGQVIDFKTAAGNHL